MRKFQPILQDAYCNIPDAIDRSLQEFREFDSAIARALGMTTCLRPEASIMLEIFEANRRGKNLTVSMLGLLDGIAPTTTLRYIDLLQQHGALQRVSHESDQRMRYVVITEPAKQAVQDAIKSTQVSGSASCKRAA